MRADQALVEKGLASSRTQAQQLIAEGAVYVLDSKGEHQVKKASQKISAHWQLQIRNSAIQKYVSRGGLKLEGALAKSKLNTKGLRALDVGISTGGFTDCLLKHGASEVVGIDVGHGQLAAALKNDSRVICLEGINARELSAASLKILGDNKLFDVIVIDVSFISLTLILPQLPQFLKPEGKLLALVKPQFEVGVSNLGKGGIVRDQTLFQDVELKIRQSAQAAGLEVEEYFESSIEGGDGNKEFFILASRT